MIKPELIKAEKYFSSIADTTNDMIHFNNTEGRIIYANKATETMLGYPLNEIINTFAFEIIHPDDIETIKNDMSSVSTDNQLPSREIRLLKKDDSYIDVEIRGFVIALDEDKYLGAIIRDISSRKKREKELAVYRNRLEKLVKERTQKLEKALDEIKTLKGILPICMHCKKIRDDDGYWNQIEKYIHDRSEAEFTHSICPECIEKHYPEFKK